MANTALARRVVLYNKAYVFEIIDLGANWFESATVDTNIITYGKRKAEVQDKINSYKISLCDDIISAKKEKVSGGEKECFIYPKKDNSSWIILNEDERSILTKLDKFTPLYNCGIYIKYGIRTGYNNAFIIDENIKNNLISLNSNNEKLIKPLFRGRDIDRYEYVFSNQYIILAYQGCYKDLINNHIEIYNYLLQYKNHLENRGQVKDNKNRHWIELDNSATKEYLSNFETDKIAWQRITDKNKFVFSEKGQYILDSMAFISGFKNTDEAYYILSILNSELVYFWIKHNVHEYGDTGFRLSNQYVELIPIATADENTKNKLVNLVDDIIRLKKENKDSSDIEAEVDKIVYSLYGLSDEEIKIIEGEY